MTYHIFIGYDDREKEAYQVAKHTVEKHATVPVQVHKLDHKELRLKGLYARPSMVQGLTGQYIDAVDGRPFSTQFTFTRFLIGELWKEIKDSTKSPLVMFVDSDFMWFDDIGEMFKEIEDQKMRSGGQAPVYCVQHDYKPMNNVKMDNIIQCKYNMKLWAAMMVWDMDNPLNEKVTPELVNNELGRNLMNFCWIENSHIIGTIKERWHFVPNHSEKNTDDPIGAIHWTEGGPYFNNYRNARYSNEWFREYKSLLKEKLESNDVESLIDCS